MKILEIKNNLVKISYEVSDNLVLSGFVIIADKNAPYVAQIINLKADNEINYAIVKLLFTFTQDGIVNNYDGSIPSLTASLDKLSTSELLEILPLNTPIALGNIAQQNFMLNVDKSVLENNLVICSDKLDNSNVLIENFTKQIEKLNEKSIIFDVDGEYENENKLVFGKDFKLPLNYETINFIYDNDLNDVEATSKAVIQEIFLEVQKYTRTIPDGFIPFDTFISVVDQQYKESNIPELALLKNKLLKYDEEKVFAQNINEINSLKQSIYNNKTIVLDISNMDFKLQKELFTHVYNVMESLHAFFYSFVKLNNNNADKKLLKRFLTGNAIYTTIICNHNYKYIQELKEYAGNLLFFAPQMLQHDFAAYNTFLGKLNPNEFIIYGKVTQNIPLIIELDKIDVDEIVKSELLSNTSNKTVEDIPVEEEQPEVVTEVEKESEQIEVSDSFSDNFNPFGELNATSINEVAYEEEETSQQTPTLEDNETFSFEDDGEYIPENDYSAPNTNYNERDNNTVIEQVARDVDEVFYNNYKEEIPPIDEISMDESLFPDEIQEENTEFSYNGDDELTEDDLNFIEDINNDEDNINDVVEENSTKNEFQNYNESEEINDIIEIDDIIEEESSDFTQVIDENYDNDGNSGFESLDESSEISEEFQDINEISDVNDFITEEESTPIVPIYPVDDVVETSSSDIEAFEPGDQVTHPKYGEGIVEKMIKYGNKTLCSISFNNVGRRLLDPAISEITKLQ